MCLLTQFSCRKVRKMPQHDQNTQWMVVLNIITIWCRYPFENVVCISLLFDKSKAIGWQSIVSGHLKALSEETFARNIVWINNLMAIMFRRTKCVAFNPECHKPATILSKWYLPSRKSSVQPNINIYIGSKKREREKRQCEQERMSGLNVCYVMCWQNII